jgi:hypothetical protein
VEDNKIQNRINNEEDFVHCPKMNNSIIKIVDKYPDGVEDSYIAKVLLMTEQEVVKIYEAIILKIRQSLNIK